jgi:Domain of unknown function (DUF4410)
MRITHVLSSGWAVVLVVSGYVLSGGLASAKEGPTYGHLVIQSFDTSSADDFPADFRDSLRRNLVKHLQDTGRFRSITLIEPGTPLPADADIVLTGKIVKFQKGNRAERYMVPGLGTTSIRAWIEFTETATGKSLLKKEVNGKVFIGVFGGDSKGATNGLAKQLAGSVKKSLP